MWENGDLLGKEGSEGGQVLKDEIYEKGCRVTLEKCPKYYAITCGVFGSFCHTAFCSEKKSEALYEQIKNELLEELKQNSLSTQSVIGVNSQKPINNGDEVSLSNREQRIARAMGLTPSEYAKWR